MKYYIHISLVSMLVFFTACSVLKTSSQESSTVSWLTPERPIPYPVEEPAYFLQAVRNGSRTLTGKPGNNYWTNYSEYKLHAHLSPSDTMLYGEADITYTNNSPDTLRVIIFELPQNLHKQGVPRKQIAEITGGMHIQKVAVEGKDLGLVNRFQPGYVVQGTNMIVIPEKPVLPGKQAHFEIDWNFKVPQAGASARMGYSRDNLFFIAYWYPHLATYDDIQGWFTDSFTGNAEFYHGFGDYDITITAPPEWIVMSSGSLENPQEVLAPSVYERYQRAGESDEVISIVSESDFGNVTTGTDSMGISWKFRANRVRDVAFSATLESKWDGLRTPIGDLNNDNRIDYSRIHAFWRNSAPLWKDGAAFTAHSISFLSDFTRLPYPWPHMTSVEGGGIIGGGMEFPMITLIGDYNNRKSSNFYDVVAHEIGHMWMPMVVSSNERRHAWMDEGSTTFHEANARWDIFPDSFDRQDEFNSYLGIAGTYLEGEIMRWSDYHYPGPAYGVASYPKPGSVLIALQGVIGEEVFNNAWREYIRRWAYKHPTPYDMFNTFEDVSGMNLDWFWRAWYFETWALDQAVKNVIQTDTKATIQIRDLGEVPMPVLLTLTLENGTTIEERIAVTDWLRGLRETSIEVNIQSPVKRVEIDKDNYFPDKDRSNNVWSN